MRLTVCNNDVVKAEKNGASWFSKYHMFNFVCEDEKLIMNQTINYYTRDGIRQFPPKIAIAHTWFVKLIQGQETFDNTYIRRASFQSLLICRSLDFSFNITIYCPAIIQKLCMLQQVMKLIKKIVSKVYKILTKKCHQKGGGQKKSRC